MLCTSLTSILNRILLFFAGLSFENQMIRLSNMANLLQQVLAGLTPAERHSDLFRVTPSHHRSKKYLFKEQVVCN